MSGIRTKSAQRSTSAAGRAAARVPAGIAMGPGWRGRLAEKPPTCAGLTSFTEKLRIGGAAAADYLPSTTGI
jgi:hypothetical protein